MAAAADSTLANPVRSTTSAPGAARCSSAASSVPSPSGRRRSTSATSNPWAAFCPGGGAARWRAGPCSPRPRGSRPGCRPGRRCRRRGGCAPDSPTLLEILQLRVERGGQRFEGGREPDQVHARRAPASRPPPRARRRRPAPPGGASGQAVARRPGRRAGACSRGPGRTPAPGSPGPRSRTPPRPPPRAGRAPAAGAGSPPGRAWARWPARPFARSGRDPRRR